MTDQQVVLGRRDPISHDQAVVIASAYSFDHRGGPIIAFIDTGVTAVVSDEIGKRAELLIEAIREEQSRHTGDPVDQLNDLIHYVEYHGGHGPVEGWELLS